MLRILELDHQFLPVVGEVGEQELLAEAALNPQHLIELARRDFLRLVVNQFGGVSPEFERVDHFHRFRRGDGSIAPAEPDVDIHGVAVGLQVDVLDIVHIRPDGNPNGFGRDRLQLLSLRGLLGPAWNRSEQDGPQGQKHNLGRGREVVLHAGPALSQHV